MRGNPAGTIWWSHLLYGMSPHGLDVRLSVDLHLQQHADEMMLSHVGAAVMLNAQTGEILVMASHPTFNPNHLNEIGAQLNKDPSKPLINRAVQGLYPTGTLMQPFMQAVYQRHTLSPGEMQSVYKEFGFDRAPLLNIETSQPFFASDRKDLHVSPLQVALASAALSNQGKVPAPRIATSVNTPREGWVVLPTLGTPFEAIQESAAKEAAQSFIQSGKSYWSHIGRAGTQQSPVTWFIAGTPPDWKATPLVIVVTLEEDNERIAQWIGEELLNDAMTP
jgi:membrane peptidoglycan carboxypeptidase